MDERTTLITYKFWTNSDMEIITSHYPKYHHLDKICTKESSNLIELST